MPTVRNKIETLTGRSVVKAALLAMMIIGATGLSAGANAQEQGTREVLEEIVVTAQRREESLQETQISITVFSESDLRERHIQDMSDLDNFTPNLRFNYTAPISATASTAAVFIRGVGQNDYQLSVDPGIGMYLDGVYISRAIGGVLENLEIERIEVLRGPQGTLYGRNTIGGAINIITRKPHDELSGDVEVGTGSDQLVETRGRINVPLTDALYGSASINIRKQDAYVDNVGSGPDLGEVDRVSGRFALLFEPREDLSLHLSADGTRIREQSSAFVLIEALEGGILPFIWNGMFSGDPICADPTNPARLANPSCANAQWALGEGRTAATFQTQNPSDGINFVSDRRYESASDIDVNGFSATLDWQISDQYSFKSITAFREVEGFWTRDTDGSPNDVNGTINDWDQEQFSQEFQVLGDSVDGRLQWVLGAYYSDEEGTHFDFPFFWASNTLFQSGATIDAESLAFFGQATFDPSDRWQLTAGIRWTRDEKDFFVDQFVLEDAVLGLPPGSRILPLGDLNVKTEPWTPMLGALYRINENLNFYVKYSEGFKGGGFTQRVFPPLPEIPEFSKEEVESYEFGLKFQGLDDRLRANFAAFYTDYTDIQLLGQDPVLQLAPIVFNAGEATIKGLELEMTALLGDSWQVNGGLGYVDAGYDNVDPFAQAVGVDESKEFVNTPEWTANVGIRYEHTTPMGTFTPRLDWTYTSEIFNDVTNAVAIAQDDYHLVNLAVTYESPDALWLLSLAGVNLTDEKYKDSGHFDPGVGTAEAVFTRGREYRVSVRRLFGE